MLVAVHQPKLKHLTSLLLLDHHDSLFKTRGGCNHRVRLHLLALTISIIPCNHRVRLHLLALTISIIPSSTIDIADFKVLPSFFFLLIVSTTITDACIAIYIHICFLSRTPRTSRSRFWRLHASLRFHLKLRSLRKTICVRDNIFFSIFSLYMHFA